MGIPGTFAGFQTYTAAPSRVEAADSTAYYGVLCRKIADRKLYYLVVRVSAANPTPAIVWSSAAGAGNGEIRATSDNRLQVAWRLHQNEGSPIEFATIEEFVPPGPPPKPAADPRGLIVDAFRALLSVEAFADWRRRLDWE